MNSADQIIATLKEQLMAGRRANKTPTAIVITREDYLCLRASLWYASRCDVRQPAHFMGVPLLQGDRTYVAIPIE